MIWPGRRLVAAHFSRGSPAELMHQYLLHDRSKNFKGRRSPWSAFIGRLLNKDQDQRFQSPAELLIALPTIRRATDEE
jgi:hypothetical protein